MSKKQQIIDLWKTSFNDSDTFIQFYFNKVYKDENALTITKNGKIISALQLIPYDMTYGKETISVGYISGACTDPSERGKGWMHQLLLQAFEMMKERNMTITVLIPAEKSLFYYYQTQGYTPVYDYSLRLFSIKEPGSINNHIQIKPLNEELFHSSYIYFDRKLRERPMSILHSEDDFKNIVTDNRLDGGDVAVATNEKNDVTGIAFISFAEDKKIIIKEILYNREEIKNALLTAIANHYKTPQLIYKTPPSLPDTHPYGMAMVIDRQKMITLWKATNPENPHSFDLLNTMNIQELTALTLGYNERKAYMNLMMD
ncbi:GNAT family N-acetyltransferase [Parabacteroides sp. PF5-9]|uniref:GNAT family N-acetyltransferase n=1 Tax=Parabacteroides sp. PF5-9 TaxID=1742404 RepID=UPI0024731659|nr:GNAT family N-acetyltransferase [Parabacteroides sp. PF5-9]MDH6358769.1 putative acetyltransferase [Parabacteroides sp. PF5-9]